MARVSKRVLAAAALAAALSGLAGLATAGTGSVTYTYDSLGRVKTITYDTGHVVTYTYDPADNRATKTVT